MSKQLMLRRAKSKSKRRKVQKSQLGKRTWSQLLKKKFLELEAEESDEVKKQPTADEIKQQFYKDEDLKPNANRLDESFIKKLEIKALKESENAVKLEIKDDCDSYVDEQDIEVDEV